MSKKSAIIITGIALMFLLACGGSGDDFVDSVPGQAGSGSSGGQPQQLPVFDHPVVTFDNACFDRVCP